jgi:tRNA(fMet)-specific endonuclease VapC
LVAGFSAYLKASRQRLLTKDPHRQLRVKGQAIGPFDVLLAGHALAFGAVMVRPNIDEFSRVPILAIEDWQTG